MLIPGLEDHLSHDKCSVNICRTNKRTQTFGHYSVSTPAALTPAGCTTIDVNINHLELASDPQVKGLVLHWTGFTSHASHTLGVPRAATWALVVKNPPANAGDIRNAELILGLGRSLEEGMVTHFSILAWRIPWTEEHGGLQSLGSQRVRHD